MQKDKSNVYSHCFSSLSILSPPPFISFQGQKYVLGTPGRTGEVDEDERHRLQEERRRQRQVADVLSQRREGEGKEEEEDEGEVWPGLWGANDDEEEDEESRATSVCT